MKTIIYISLVLVFCFANNVFADVYWDKTFGGYDNDEGFSVQQTTEGGYIIAGCTWSYGAGETDIWLIKTDASGIKQWDKTFGGNDNDSGNSLQQTTDGGYIITGGTNSYGAGDCDVWLIKTDAYGVKQWDKTFGGTFFDIGYSVQQTTDGGYIIVGSTVNYGTSVYAVYLIKTDAAGELQWDNGFGTPSHYEYDCGRSVQQTTDGGYIITGDTTSYGSGTYDVLLIKTDAFGNKQWDRTFSADYFNDNGYSVQQTTDGGYIIAGATGSYGPGEFDVWLIKTGPLGWKQWDKTFGGSNNDYGYSVQQTSDEGYIIAGMTDSYGSGSFDVWLIYYNPERNEASISNLNLLSVFLIIISLSIFLFLKRKRV